MEIKKLSSIPKNSNPFNYDLFHMGIELGNLTIMFADHNKNDYVIIVNKETGERCKIIINENESTTKIYDYITVKMSSDSHNDN